MRLRRSLAEVLVGFAHKVDPKMRERDAGMRNFNINLNRSSAEIRDVIAAAQRMQSTMSRL